MTQALISVVIIIVIAGSIINAPGPATVWVTAQENVTADVIVYPPDSRPFGLSHEEWSIGWWQWLNSIPRSSNPLTDTSGKNCNVQQYGPVWFLAGSNGLKIERSCNIPEGKAIFFPIVNAEGSFAENPLIKTEEQLRSGLVELIDQVTFIEATVDGSKLQNLKEHRVMSGLFNFSFPEDNDSGAPPGPTTAVSDGYWVMLHPLPVGSHEISMRGAVGDPTTTGSVSFVTDVTYHVNIIQSDSKFQLMTQTVDVGEDPVAYSINSSSTLTDFHFSEADKRINFKVSGSDGMEGVTILSMSKVMSGPYAVFIDGHPAHFESHFDETNNGTSLKLSYLQGMHDVSIVGTSIVPEFPVIMIMIILPIAIGSVVYSVRRSMFDVQK